MRISQSEYIFGMNPLQKAAVEKLAAERLMRNAIFALTIDILYGVYYNLPINREIM